MKYPEIKLVKRHEIQQRLSIDTERLESRSGMFALEDYIELRANGSLKDQAFFLPEYGHDWIIGRDYDGILVLVPLKKVD